MNHRACPVPSSGVRKSHVSRWGLSAAALSVLALASGAPGQPPRRATTAGESAPPAKQPPAAAVDRPAAPAAAAPVRRTVRMETILWSGADGSRASHAVLGSEVQTVTKRDGIQHYQTAGRLQFRDANGKWSAPRQTRMPVLLRDPETQQIGFGAPGPCALLEAVVNQTIAQVKPEPRPAGYYEETVKLGLGHPLFPTEVRMRMRIEPAPGAAEGSSVWLARASVDELAVAAFGADGKPDGAFSVAMSCVCVFDAEQGLVLQADTAFTAAHRSGEVRIESHAMAVADDGRPIRPQIDTRRELAFRADAAGGAPIRPQIDTLRDLASRAHAAEGVSWGGPLPLVAVQGVKVREAVSAALFAAVERRTNPLIASMAGDVLFLDDLLDYAGASPLEALASAWGEAYGGEAGKLAGKFLYNTASAGLGEVLPATLAFPPIIAPLAAAYSIYQIYSPLAELGGALLANQVAQLRPFEWPKGTPSQRLAQAEKLFPTDGAGRLSNWDGGAWRGSNWQPKKGLALRQAEQLAGRTIEQVQVPGVQGAPAGGGAPSAAPPAGGATPGTTAPGTPGGTGATGGPGTGTGAPGEPGAIDGAPGDDAMTDDVAEDGEVDDGETGDETPGEEDAGDEMTQEKPEEPPQPDVQMDPKVWRSHIPPKYGPAPGGGTTGGAPSPIQPGGLPLEGIGTALQSAPAPAPVRPAPRPPAPRTVQTAPAPGAGPDPALVGLGIAGAVAGAAAIAVAAGSAGGMGGSSYHCSEGSSYCPGAETCCPTHHIGGGQYGSYFFPGMGCYGSADAAARVSVRTGRTPYPCVDERR
jgi:hypothetical protein